MQAAGVAWDSSTAADSVKAVAPRCASYFVGALSKVLWETERSMFRSPLKRVLRSLRATSRHAARRACVVALSLAAIIAGGGASSGSVGGPPGGGGGGPAGGGRGGRGPRIVLSGPSKWANSRRSSACRGG